MYFDVFFEMYGTQDSLDDTPDYEYVLYDNDVCITENTIGIVGYLKWAGMALAGMFAVVSVALAFFLLLIGG